MRQLPPEEPTVATPQTMAVKGVYQTRWYFCRGKCGIIKWTSIRRVFRNQTTTTFPRSYPRTLSFSNFASDGRIDAIPAGRTIKLEWHPLAVLPKVLFSVTFPSSKTSLFNKDTLIQLSFQMKNNRCFRLLHSSNRSNGKFTVKSYLEYGNTAPNLLEPLRERARHQKKCPFLVVVVLILSCSPAFPYGQRRRKTHQPNWINELLFGFCSSNNSQSVGQHTPIN